MLTVVVVFLILLGIIASVGLLLGLALLVGDKRDVRSSLVAFGASAALIVGIFILIAQYDPTR